MWAAPLLLGAVGYYVVGYLMSTRELEMVADAFALEGETVELDDKGQLRGEALVKLVHGLGRRITEWRGRALTAERKFAQSAKRVESYLKVITEREQTNAELRQRCHDLATENQSLKDAEAAHVAELANARARIEAQNAELNRMAFEHGAMLGQVARLEKEVARLKRAARRKS